MATRPDQIRNGLTLITAAAAAELRQVADAYAEPQAQSAALFVAAPLIVSEYMDGSSALALDWYEELREESPATSPFVPQPVTTLREDYIGNVVGWATKPLLEAVPDVLADIEAEMVLALAKIEAEIQKEVAAAFRETIVENVQDDPDAVGWRRFARPQACNFCRLLADKGAIFKADSARFAAHTNCHCLAAPVFDGQPGEQASVEQYTASRRTRTPAERQALREYLADKYGA